MLIPGLSYYKGSPLVMPTLGLIEIPAPVSGTLKNIYLFLSSDAPALGSLIFNLRKNGVQLFTGAERLVVPSGTRAAQKTDLNIAVMKGDDILRLDLEQTANVGGRVASPIWMLLEIEDNLGTTWTLEQLQDAVAAMMTNGSHTSWVYNDAAGTLSVDAVQLTDEEIQDKVAAFIAQGTNVTVTYNDAGNTLTIASTDTTRTDEEIQDVVAALLQQGANVTLTYNDAANTLSIAASGGSGGTTWLNGAGAPASGLGADGNYYLNTTNGAIYLKTSGTWSAIYTPSSGGLPFSYYDYDKPPASPNSVNDEFSGSSLDGAWTQYGAADMTLSVADHLLEIAQTHTAGAKVSGIYKALPSGDWFAVCKVFYDDNFNTAAANQAAGIALFQDGADTTKKITICSAYTLDTVSIPIFVDYTNRTTANGGLTATSDTGANGVRALYRNVYLVLKKVGTTYQVGYSMDGFAWRYPAAAVSLSYTPIHIGIASNLLAPTGSTRRVWFDFIRLYTTMPKYLGGLRS